MSILPHHKYLTRSPTHLSSYRDPCLLRTRLICSAMKTANSKPKPTQLAMEPKLVSTSNLVTPIGNPVLNDPSLQSTWSHRALVATGCTTVLISLAKAIVAAAGSDAWLQTMLAGYVGYLFADLGSGVYHWGIDNYGDASTPIFGAQIDAFQGHHKWPWTITRRQFANNLHALAKVVALFVLPVDLFCNGPVIHGFVSVGAGCIMFSQQFHAWAHGTKSKLPPPVVALQDAGLLVSRSQHSAHHRQPYNNNYCIVSGVCNEFLDNQKVFEALEMVLFFQLGVRPRSWSEPTSDWIEEVETSSHVTAQ
ncbi:fatty acid desaturase 4, chloroplastic [Mercurialis annua]|uniref:fatty acid desaturase 4, chloroplastic n=1 Tax=Mercurialis annua TaxID=3986 RepID=UPI0021604FB5|nr:fatty acid desaturase 4, chloroplastic [Mercurialis annua]